MTYRENLNKAIQDKNSRLCVGLDPKWQLLPNVQDISPSEKALANALFDFNKLIIDTVAEFSACVKPQVAYYEMLGAAGYAAYERTIAYAQQQGLLVVGDAKRGDIGTTSAAYAEGHLADELKGIFKTPVKRIAADALTVNPFLGSDGVKPFIETAKANNKGLYVLLKTSNPSSSELQDLKVDGKPLYQHLATLFAQWQNDHDFDSLGAVVGATHPDELKAIRSWLPKSPLLIPGYGAQGGKASDLSVAFNDGGLDAVINSSRGVIYAWRDKGIDEGDSNSIAEHIRNAAREARDDINSAVL